SPRAARSREVAARRPVSTAGPVLACAALVVAASMSMPVAGAILLFLLLTTARTVDRFLAGLRGREETSRTRRRAVTVQLLTSPWAFASAALRTLVTMILPVGIAAATAYAAAQLIPAYLGWHAYNGNAAVGLGAAAAVVAVWIGPGGTAHRRSTRRAVRAITPSPTASLALTGAIVIAVAAIALVVWRYPVIDWTPLPKAPTRGL
ncbi:hypothetical protein, partial [Cumulibacter manganitolerans]|uniref:hypothetical protein n=1 Tax=Cumulibacter manganitolerans TaxID=1884992 RepID=UPI001E4A926C